MKLEVRDRLAELCLAALADPAAEPALGALVAFARAARPGGAAPDLGEGSGTRLLAAGGGLFEARGGALRLRPDLLGDLGALKDRARRIEGAVARCRSRCGARPAAPAGGAPGEDETHWALCAASVLFNAELFFEVHELLEAYWIRADGTLRTFLQGLIQVAVGFHHRARGNRRGAQALLAAGGAKLAPFRPRAHGLELEGFCRAVERIASAPVESTGTYDVSAPKLRRRPRIARRSAITR